jgi:hypothetical protein
MKKKKEDDKMNDKYKAYLLDFLRFLETFDGILLTSLLVIIFVIIIL